MGYGEMQGKWTFYYHNGQKELECDFDFGSQVSVATTYHDNGTIKDVVNIIVDKFNFKVNVVWQSDKPDGQFRKPSDNSKLLSYLPNFKFTPIEEGIEKTVKWFIENYEDIRN